MCSILHLQVTLLYRIHLWGLEPSDIQNVTPTNKKKSEGIAANITYQIPKKIDYNVNSDISTSDPRRVTCR